MTLHVWRPATLVPPTKRKWKVRNATDSNGIISSYQILKILYTCHYEWHPHSYIPTKESRMTAHFDCSNVYTARPLDHACIKAGKWKRCTHLANLPATMSQYLLAWLNACCFYKKHISVHQRMRLLQPFKVQQYLNNQLPQYPCSVFCVCL
jgi:hypothetical protein